MKELIKRLYNEPFIGKLILLYWQAVVVASVLQGGKRTEKHGEPLELDVRSKEKTNGVDPVLKKKERRHEQMYRTTPPMLSIQSGNCTVKLAVKPAVKLYLGKVLLPRT